MTDMAKDFGLSELDEVALSQLREAQDEGGGVRLPFAAINAWATNGDPRLKGGLASVQYFGGFSADADAVKEMVERGDIPAMPKGWTEYTGVSKDGKEYSSIGSRWIAVAVIKGRQSWLTPDGIRSIDYREGTRRHLQYLCLMANEKQAFCPVVITGKGYQAGYILSAIQEWEKAIAPIKKTLNISHLPRSAFWFTLGTHGDKPEFVSKGSKAQSNVTPIHSILPDKMDAEWLKGRFIGADNVRMCAALLASAQDWLNAWKDGKGGQDLVAQAVSKADPNTGEIDDW